MATLYDEIGMRRKGALFKRLAGMQCVALSNPKPTWQQCYHLLLDALEGYKLSLDPKDIPSDHPYGWPLVQMRVLHEIIFTARKMGNPAIAIRHLCYLLHTMFPHLRTAEKRELSSILESYTVRCEAAPQSLALENGTILPPVPFLRFPVVKSFKLVAAPPHLCPVKLKPANETDDSMSSSQELFIYSPLQQRNKAQHKPEVRWVEGDMCEAVLQLYNPMPYELRITNMGLLSEGCACEMYSQSLSLPAESGPYQVKITVGPKDSGIMDILGYTTKVLGVRSHCRLRDLSNIPEDRVKVKVIPCLPKLKVTTSLPKDSSFSSLANSDIVVTSASACLYAGQSVECQVTLTNTSKMPIEYIALSMDSKVDKEILKETVMWNEDNLRSQLPLQPTTQASFTVYISSASDVVTCDNLINSMDPNSQSSKRSGRDTPEELYSTKVLESLLKIQYSGGAGLADGFCRQCAIALAIEIQPSVLVQKWNVIPAPSSTHCNLVLDLENVTQHTMEIINEKSCILSIGSGQCKRCAVQLRKCNMAINQDSIHPTTDGDFKNHSTGLTKTNQSRRNTLEGAAISWQRKVLTDHLYNFVDVRWKLMSEQKEGHLSIEKLHLSSSHLALLQLSTTRWDLQVGDHNGETHIPCTCGVPTPVQWTMYNLAEHSICQACISVRLYQDHWSGIHHTGLLHHTVVVSGLDTVTVNKILPGSSCTNTCSLMFLEPGTYKLQVTCQGQGLLQGQSHLEGQGQEPLSESCSITGSIAPDLFDSWHHSPTLILDVSTNN